MIDTKKQAQNLNQALLRAMESYPHQTCFKVKKGEHYHNVSYREFQELTFRMVNFLLERGISKGERVALAIDNCLEWMVICVATLLAGGVVVPLRPKIAVDTLRFVLQDSGAGLVVLENKQLIQAMASLVEAEESPLPDLHTILTMKDLQEAEPFIIPTSSILTNAAPLTPEECQALSHYTLSTAPETLAVIHYTAGETGRLKGAVFDHARQLKTMHHVNEWLKLDEDDLAFTVMSWGYASSLTVALHYFLSGVANVLSEADDEAIPRNMQQTSPTVTFNMPIFFEQFYNAVMDGIIGQPESTQKVFQWAVAKGKEYLTAGQDASKELRQEYSRADLTFFNQIRGYIGGRMRYLYSAGAPLRQELAEFFEVIGLPILNVYSVTEAGGFPFVSQPETGRRINSCGQLAPGFEARLAEDGEVWVRGETCMWEYWGWPSDVQQVIDSEGWLHTGDLGYLDQEGFFYLTGRKQPVMRLISGHKVKPVIIEETLMNSPFIAHAVVFGESRPYVSALIVPYLETLVAKFQEDEEVEKERPASPASPTSTKWLWRQEHSDSELMTTSPHPKVKTLLDKEIAKVNGQLDPREQIKAYCLLEQAFSKAANDLVQATTQGRHIVAERYQAEIELMYPQRSQVSKQAVTQVQVTPKRLQELIEKESILDAWLSDAGIQFLFDLARAKQIDPPSMVNISDAAATIAQMESEEKPLSTALIVGDPVRIARVLPESQIRLLRHDHIRRMRHVLVSLAKMVDGLALGYVVDKHGYVRGVHKLNVDLKEGPANFLLGPQFRHHAAISRQCEAVIFFVPTGGRQVRVFADGRLMGRYSNGDWSPETISQVDEAITSLAEEKNYNTALIQRVLGCAFQMSEENMGAIFIIGNADTILTYSDASEISHFAVIVSDELDHLSDQELINFAKQDGATLVDADGRFRGCMVLLRPDAGTQAEIGLGKGARHSSAAKMSAEAQCLAITVSQDGPITIYDSGRRMLSL